MELFNRIIGQATDAAIAERLHQLSHAGHVDEVRLARADLARRRIRAVTSDGRDIAIALSREERLGNGAVLELTAERALVVRVEEAFWLRLDPSGMAQALALGYHAGNLHWRVRFRDQSLLVALEGEPDRYIERLQAAMPMTDVAIVIEDENGEVVDSIQEAAHG